MPENSRKPLLLVDVDGVLSLFGPGLDIRSAAGRWRLADGIPHFLSVEGGEHLRELAADFELAWCTGWEHKANDELVPHYGLPQPLPVISFDAVPQNTAHWKLAAIEHFAGPERAVAWIDDLHCDNCREWAAARPGPTRLVTTDPARGLTAEEARELREWARELRDRGLSAGTGDD